MKTKHKDIISVINHLCNHGHLTPSAGYNMKALVTHGMPAVVAGNLRNRFGLAAINDPKDPHYLLPL